MDPHFTGHGLTFRPCCHLQSQLIALKPVGVHPASKSLRDSQPRVFREYLSAPPLLSWTGGRHHLAVTALPHNGLGPKEPVGTVATLAAAYLAPQVIAVAVDFLVSLADLKLGNLC